MLKISDCAPSKSSLLMSIFLDPCFINGEITVVFVLHMCYFTVNFWHLVKSTIV